MYCRRYNIPLQCESLIDPHKFQRILLYLDDRVILKLSAL